MGLVDVRSGDGRRASSRVWWAAGDKGRRLVSFGMAAGLLLAGVQGQAQSGSAPATTQVEKAAPGATETREAAKPSQQAKASATSTPLLPPPAGLDLQGRSHDVLGHLNAVVRYFRLAVAPIQKVGEPSDMLYRDQALAQATQIADLAFQSGKADAALLAAFSKQAGSQTAAPAEGEAQKLQGIWNNVAARLAALKVQAQTLDDELKKAKPKQRAALEQQAEQTDGDIQLYTAMNDAMRRISATTDAGASSGLGGDIIRLQHSVPELAASQAKTVVPTPLASLSATRSAGVASQAVVLFQLLSTKHAIDAWVDESDQLHQQAIDLRTPLQSLVRQVVASGQTLSQQSEAQTASVISSKQAPPVEDVQAVRKRYDSVTATFNAISAALVPLTQEIITIEQSKSNLLAWRAVVDTEYREILQDLLLRVLAIGSALVILLLLSSLWQRATSRYVHDARRRRQLMVTRRVVVGFLSGLVMIFGVVTQFSSLATFAGFITAGIAVGLQTILLSVAAYFFIVGRYGVRVGDRITVVGVTGDVIEVGLVRFYMMELAGSGTELQPTGRVAVFANSVLFQSGTPLYRQMPGAEYGWHELSVKLATNSNYTHVCEELTKIVGEVYEAYKQRVEGQHRQVEAWMEAAIPAPGIDSRLQLVEGGLQLYIRYPVELQDASQIDQKVTQAVVKLIDSDAEVKEAVTGAPTIRALVKG